MRRTRRRSTIPPVLAADGDPSNGSAVRPYRPARWLGGGLALAVVVAVSSWLMYTRAAPLVDDFMSYWAATRLLAHGANPYDLDALLQTQRTAGWPYGRPLATWYGPWILALAAPVGLLPYWPARIAWLLGGIVALVAAARILSRVYAFERSDRTPLLIAISMAPALLSLFEGQITPVSLLGLSLFLLLIRTRPEWLAGAALLPVTAKPLGLYLIFAALLLWTARVRRAAAAAGLLAAVGAGSVLAWMLRPGAFADWMSFSAAASPLAQTFTPTVGSLLRHTFGVQRTWLAYLPAALGLVWLGVTARLYDDRLDWAERLVPLSLLSLLTTPFAWSHDALLLLPAVLERARRGVTPFHRRWWILMNGLAVALYPLLRYNQEAYILYPLALLALDSMSARRATDHEYRAAETKRTCP